MVTVPSPRTWATNDEPTASMLNTELRDAYNFLWNPPRVVVYRSTSQSFASPGAGNNRTVLTWTSEVMDSDGMFSGSPGSPSSRLTVMTAGIYEIVIHIEWQVVNTTSSQERFCAIKKNNNAGTTYGNAAELAMDHAEQVDSDASGAPQTNHTSIFHQCVVGDYFEVLASHTANTSVTTLEDAAKPWRTFFSMLWLGTV